MRVGSYLLAKVRRGSNRPGGAAYCADCMKRSVFTEHFLTVVSVILSDVLS